MPEPTVTIECKKCGADVEPLVTNHGDNLKCRCGGCEGFLCFVTPDEEDLTDLLAVARAQADRLKGEARL